jgi:hypothetical protein
MDGSSVDGSICVQSTLNDGEPVKKPFCSRRDHFGAIAAPAAKFEELVASSSNRLQILRRWRKQTLYPKMLKSRSQKAFLRVRQRCWLDAILPV